MRSHQEPVHRKVDRLELFRSIYEANEARVRKTLFWLVSQDLADDLVQEVFVRVWNHLDDFRGESQVSTWIYRISVNVAQDSFRKRKELPTGVDDLEVIAPDNQERLLSQKQLVAQGIRKLSDTLRGAFVLFYQQELSLREVAEALGISEGTVKSRLHEGREAFKAFLLKHGTLRGGTYEW